ncbi:MAG: hypothetical protein L3J25_06640 [Flavobacteriaceae bacterium]|nr:hypothetical protein [Flavobacteriaceae bacterium]
MRILLYESVYQSDITYPIPQDVMNIPEARVYIEKFGQKKDDYCLAVNLNDQIIGAVWVRNS